MSVKSSGTATPAGATETDIYETVDIGVYTLTIDLSDMANADDLIIRSYTKVLSGGSYVLAQVGRYFHAQGIKVVVTPPVSSPYAIKWTYERVAGAVDSLPWRVDKL